MGGHKLNFPDNDTEVNPKKIECVKYIGVFFVSKTLNWRVKRHSTHEKKTVCYGNYKDEETAGHASDTLARKLIENGEKGHKLNFPDDRTEVHPKNQTNKRKRPADFEDYQKCGQLLNEFK